MRSRLARIKEEDGFTLIELLVASMLGAVVMGAVVLLVIGAVRHQPKISKQAQNITTARWVLDRLTHEIRNGIAVTKAEPSTVTFQAYVRHSTCGGTASLPSSTAAIKCYVTYSCTTSACSRSESASSASTGTPKQIFDGINSSQVFSYTPAVTESSQASSVTYVKATFTLPNPSGNGGLTVSSGASLRNATLGY
jgi:prepilin-type N-terminal cleavage/methylation domain-containing protein